MPAFDRIRFPHKAAYLVAPKITHLQAFVLFQLARGEKRGKDLRRALDGEGMLREHVPTFLACVKRLERDRLITSRFVKASGGAHGRERCYALTAAGRKAIEELREFYRRLERHAGG